MYRLLSSRNSLFASLLLPVLLLAGCESYDVPGGDKPWPVLGDFPERPDPEEMDRRRRALYGQYGDLESALPAPAETPVFPPAGALQVAVIQFPRAAAGLDARALEVLAQVAAYAKQARADVMLFGYSSLQLELASGGNARQASQRLAADRVRAVGLALAEAGVPAERLSLIARGALDPAFAEESPAGEAGNRRVEIYFTR